MSSIPPCNSFFSRRQALWLGLVVAASSTAVVTHKALSWADKHRDVAEYQDVTYRYRELLVDGQTALKDRAAAKGICYGAASAYGTLSSDMEFAVHYTEECDILIPENDLKWRTLRPTPTTFDFMAADWMMEFAQTHQVKMRGHTLVWHESLPPWFKETVNEKNAEQVILNHIQTVARRYAGKMHSWDVINEAVWVPDGRPDGLRKTPWLEFLGPNYIELSFRTAAEADPDAKLVYNDFALEFALEDSDAKREAVLQLLSRLIAKGTPIHALGLQGHLGDLDNVRRPIDGNKLRNFLSDVTALGLEIFITELDVKDRLLPADIVMRDRIVASIYEDFLSIVLDEPRVTTVTTWGLSDRYTWLSEFDPRNDGLAVRPLPLDASLNRKLAWNAIARAFDSAPQR